MGRFTATEAMTRSLSCEDGANLRLTGLHGRHCGRRVELVLAAELRRALAGRDVVERARLLCERDRLVDVTVAAVLAQQQVGELAAALRELALARAQEHPAGAHLVWRERAGI